MVYCSEYSSPVGPLLLTSDGCALTGLWMDTQTPPPADTVRDDTLPVFAAARRWLDRYFAGERPEISFPLSPAGTDFRLRVWEILLTIPYGQTRTYLSIARQLSPTMSAQAVGGAVGSNPISIIIPCHRVVGSGGKLTGYAGGLEKKMWLLDHEQDRQPSVR